MACVTSAHNWSLTNFFPLTQYHKTAHTASPNELDQILLPQSSMAPSTTFYYPHFYSQIQMEIG